MQLGLADDTSDVDLRLLVLRSQKTESHAPAKLAASKTLEKSGYQTPPMNRRRAVSPPQELRPLVLAHRNNLVEHKRLELPPRVAPSLPLAFLGIRDAAILVRIN